MAGRVSIKRAKMEITNEGLYNIKVVHVKRSVIIVAIRTKVGSVSVHFWTCLRDIVTHYQQISYMYQVS